MKDMPAEFWTQTAEALGSEPLQLIYAEAVSRLKEENPDADTLEMMLIERVAFLYVHIRNKESTQTFAHDRAYKETLQLWVALHADLRKRRDRVADQQEIVDRILTQVQLAVDAAAQTLPQAAAEEFQERLLSSLDAQGL